jgi:hypothetical protein
MLSFCIGVVQGMTFPKDIVSFTSGITFPSAVKEMT